MTQQPEALRLADELDAYHTAPHHKEAAAELRRLEAVNAQLLEALEEWEKPMSKGSLEVHRILRTAIEQAESVEPVAWAVFEGWNAHDLYLPQEYDEALKMAGYKGDHAEVKPLYTTPPAAQRQWVGLTDEEIEQEFGFIDELLRDHVYRTGAKLKQKNIG